MLDDSWLILFPKLNGKTMAKRMKTYSIKADEIHKDWFVADAENKKMLKFEKLSARNGRFYAPF